MINQKSKFKSQNCNSKFKSDIKLRSYKFSLAIIDLSDHLPNKKSAWVINNQLLRSATSIGANLVEATSSSSRLEFKKFHEIALKSANETKYWLCLLRDANLVSGQTICCLLNEVTEISNIIAASVIKLKKK